MKYFAEVEGWVWYGDGVEAHAKKYEIFKIIDEKQFDEDCENCLTGFEMADNGSVEFIDTLFRDGWDGQFFDIEDAWDFDGEFSNGTTTDELDEYPKALKVTLKQFDEYTSGGTTPVFW